VDVKPHELRERGLAFTDVLGALRTAFGEDGVTRRSLAELGALPVGPAAAQGEPTLVRDVALVRLADDMQTGMADVGGVRAVGGIVVARRDANLGPLIEDGKRTSAKEARKLPHRAADPGRMDSGAAADVHVTIAYDRLDLATRARSTLGRALAEEIGVVVLVILIFLLHVRTAVVPLLMLPVVL